jgi:hypothetical protein
MWPNCKSQQNSNRRLTGRVTTSYRLIPDDLMINNVITKRRTHHGADAVSSPPLQYRRANRAAGKVDVHKKVLYASEASGQRNATAGTKGSTKQAR